VPRVTSTVSPEEVRAMLLANFDIEATGDLTNYELAKLAARAVKDGGLGVTLDVAKKWLQRGGIPSVPLSSALELRKRALACPELEDKD
jgi:hypothetical protein